MGQLSADSVSIMFGDIEASLTDQGVQCTSEECVIQFVSPKWPFATTPAPKLKTSGANAVELAFSFSFFQLECGSYAAFCDLKKDGDGNGMFPVANIPVALVPTCFDSMCMEVINYNPQVKVKGTDTGPTTGGTVHQLQLTGFPPMSQTDMPTVYFGSTADIPADMSTATLMMQDATSYLLTVTLPSCTGVCSNADGESQVMVEKMNQFNVLNSDKAKFIYQMVTPASLDPMLTKYGPKEGEQTDGNVLMIIKVQEFPDAKEEDVTVTFGAGASAQTATIKKFKIKKYSQKNPMAKLQVLVPDGASDGDVPVVVQVTT